MKTVAIINPNESKMHAMNKRSVMNNSRGFTLVELMVVVLLTAIAVVAIYRGYTSFSHSADVQEQIIEMQQNLRIGMHMLEKDLRRAGMNEEEDENAGFEAAEASTVSFNMDLWGGNALQGEDRDELDVLDGSADNVIEDVTGDGDTPLPNDFGERIRFSRSASNRTLLREVWDCCNAAGNGYYMPPQAVVANVDALDLVYLDEDRADLDPDATPDDPDDGRTPLAGDDMAAIRSAQACLVVSTTNEDYRYTNNEEYRNLQGSLIYKAPGDNFRRRMFCKEIKIRNAGL